MLGFRGGSVEVLTYGVAEIDVLARKRPRPQDRIGSVIWIEWHG